MNHTPLRLARDASLGILTIACLASLARAQEPPPGAKPDRDATTAPRAVMGREYTSVDQLVGATVTLSPSIEARREAAREGEAADRPSATASEWLVDCNDGAVKYAVVSVGGFLGIGDKTVLVPAGDLRWDAAKESFELGWTKEQLEQRTPFDLDAAMKAGIDDAAKRAAPPTGGMHGETGRPDDRTGEGRPGEGMDGRKDEDDVHARDAAGKAEGRVADASARPGSKIVGTEFVRSACRLCKASELAALPVHAGGETFGSVDDLIVDRNRHTVVLAVVDHGATLGVGGTARLVPFDRLTPCAKGDSTNELAALCAVDATKDELARSVVYEPKGDSVIDKAAIERALSMAGEQKKTSHERR